MGAPGVAYNPSYVSIDKIVDIVYPVGSIYISTSPVSPESLFNNVGSWERITDTFLLAAGDTYKAGSTGGEATHTLTEAELPEISGSIGSNSYGSVWSTLGSTKGVFSSTNDVPSPTNTEKGTSNTRTTQVNMSFGSGQAHNNMPPYLAVYVWKRVS